MAATLKLQFDEDMDNVFLNSAEFADTLTITDNDGADVVSIAVFEFQVGAVDEKERAVFRFKDDDVLLRGYFIEYQSQRWTVVDVRPDELGMLEVRCDSPETTAS